MDLYTLEADKRINADGAIKSAQGPYGAHTHETCYYKGGVEDAC